MIKLEHIFEKMEHLQSLGDMAAKVMRVANDPMTTADDLSEIIRQDDALTAIIMKVANSAFFGSPRKINTIQEATVLLGFTAIKSISLAASVVMNGQEDNSKVICREKLWRHSLATAISSKYLADKFGRKNAEEMYTAGILHDIGMLAMFQYDAGLYNKVNAAIQERKIERTEAELELYGVNHAQVGAFILDRWNMPESLVETVLWHHAYSENLKNKENVEIIELANYITNSLGFSSVEENFDTGALILKKTGRKYQEIKSYIKDILGILSHIDILSLKI